MPIPGTRHGATPQEWAIFDVLLGLTADLLPVVSDPSAKISPSSSLKKLGKTPSRYTANRQVVGIPGWAQYLATSDDIALWAANPDYGICIQTRCVRAIDVDVPDAVLAQAIADHLAPLNLPRRGRADSNKFLLVYKCPGVRPKTTIAVKYGVIELLGTGNQFIAAGRHENGARYEWVGGPPTSIPELTESQVEQMLFDLSAAFGTSPAATKSPTNRVEMLAKTRSEDPIAQHLIDHGFVLAPGKDGALHLTCPFADEHTTEGAQSATTYFPAHTGGYAKGHFVCLHAHCAHRKDPDFKQALGYTDPSDFDVLNTVDPDAPRRFAVSSASAFAAGKMPEWVINNFLPRACLAVVYGAPGAGKSFFVLDLVCAIAAGRTWRDGFRAPQRSACVYVVAEGAGGFRGRIRAYAAHHGVDLSTLDLGIIGDAPNFLLAQDATDLIAAVQDYAPAPAVVVIDTLASVMPGGNENTGEDIGLALKHARLLHNVTGAVVLLVHHAGKDASRGVRGHSSITGGAELIVEVRRDGDIRSASVTKLKDGDDSIAPLGFKLHKVPVGIDANGDVVSSCVCIPTY